MTSIKLNQATVITFDGQVIEVFPGRRVHISQLREFELVKDKQGSHKLNIGDIHSSKDISVDNEAVSRVTQLIAEAQKAKAEFQFE